MGFESGYKNLGDLIDGICADMISTGYWFNVDTTWNTTDRSMANNAKRVLAYGAVGGVGQGNTTLSGNTSIGATSLPVNAITNFASGQIVVVGAGATAEVRVIQSVSSGTIVIQGPLNTAHSTSDPVKAMNFEIYMAFEMVNITSGLQQDATPYYAKGLRITFTNTWDPVAHTYGLTYQQSFMGYEMRITSGVSADMATLMNTYWMWFDANGFAILLTPDNNATDTHQQSLFLVVERNTNKEYADGFSNFYCYNVMNILNFHMTTMPQSSRIENFMRPFIFYTPEDTWSSNNYTLPPPLCGMNAGICLVPIQLTAANPAVPQAYAFRSVGNSKVYFIRPIIQNSRGTTLPIFQADFFFVWTAGLGLADGDIVAISGSSEQYVCRSVPSPKSTTPLLFAIKYAA
jgi:hypothetical protein